MATHGAGCLGPRALDIRSSAGESYIYNFGVRRKAILLMLLLPHEVPVPFEILYRSESGRVLATLLRLLGDLDLAEESMHEAFAAALESWTLAGIPDKPRP